MALKPGEAPFVDGATAAAIGDTGNGGKLADHSDNSTRHRVTPSQNIQVTDTGDLRIQVLDDKTPNAVPPVAKAPPDVQTPDPIPAGAVSGPPLLSPGAAVAPQTQLAPAALEASGVKAGPLLSPIAGTAAPTVAEDAVKADARKSDAIADAGAKMEARLAAQEEKKAAILEASGGGASAPSPALTKSAGPVIGLDNTKPMPSLAVPAAGAIGGNVAPAAMAVGGSGSSATPPMTGVAPQAVQPRVEAAVTLVIDLRSGPAADTVAVLASGAAARVSTASVAAPAPAPAAKADPALALQQEAAFKAENSTQAAISAELALKAPVPAAKAAPSLSYAPGVKVDLEAERVAEKVPAAEAKLQVKMGTPAARRQREARQERNGPAPRQSQPGRGLSIIPPAPTPSSAPVFNLPAAASPRRTVGPSVNAMAIIPAKPMPAAAPAASAGLFSVASLQAPTAVPDVAAARNGLGPALSTTMLAPTAPAPTGIVPGAANAIIFNRQPEPAARVAPVPAVTPAMQVQPVAVAPTTINPALGVRMPASQQAVPAVQTPRAAATGVAVSGPAAIARRPAAAPAARASRARTLNMSILPPVGFSRPQAAMAATAAVPSALARGPAVRNRQRLATVMSATSVPANAPLPRRDLSARVGVAPQPAINPAALVPSARTAPGQRPSRQPMHQAVASYSAKPSSVVVSADAAGVRLANMATKSVQNVLEKKPEQQQKMKALGLRIETPKPGRRFSGPGMGL